MEPVAMKHVRSLAEATPVEHSPRIDLLSAIRFERLDEDREPGEGEGGENGEETPHMGPFLLIPAGPGDRGHRPLPSNVDSPSIWFETFEPGRETGKPTPAPTKGVPHQVAVRIQNQGASPSFGVCVDFLFHVIDEVENGNTIRRYDVIRYASGVQILDAGESIVRFAPWIPGEREKFPGDVIVRVYDPLMDPYDKTGEDLFVVEDRHLAHRSF